MSKIIRRIINSSKAASPVAPYNHAVQVNDTVYVSGVLGLDKDSMTLVGEDTISQAKQAFKNLGHVLDAAGTSFDKVVKMTVLMQDLKDFPEFNKVYVEYFKEPYPARTAFQVAKLPMNAMIEMEAIAVVGEVETLSTCQRS